MNLQGQICAPCLLVSTLAYSIWNAQFQKGLIHFWSKLSLLEKYGRVSKTAHFDTNFKFLAYSFPKLWSSAISRKFQIFEQFWPFISNKAVLEPRVSPAFANTYFCNHCNIRFENTSKYVDTLILFSKNLNQRSLTPTWPLTPCLLRSPVWLYPRIILSKSHDNTSMYVDTVINFPNYHIHTHTTCIHTTYYVQNEWSHSLLLNSVQARQLIGLFFSWEIIDGNVFFKIRPKESTFGMILFRN